MVTSSCACPFVCIYRVEHPYTKLIWIANNHLKWTVNLRMYWSAETTICVMYQGKEEQSAAVALFISNSLNTFLNALYTLRHSCAFLFVSTPETIYSWWTSDGHLNERLTTKLTRVFNTCLSGIETCFFISNGSSS